MLPSFERPRCVRTLCESKWIYIVQWIVIITFIGIQTGSCKECTTRELLKLQEPCKMENEALVSFVGTNHTQGLCSALSRLWLCVAKYVPWCFANITHIHNALTHSPHNCQISRDDFRRIQELINDSERKGDTTPVVTQVTIQLGSTTTKEANGDDDEGYSVNRNSTFQGNGGSSPRDRNHVFFTLLVMSVTWYMKLLPVL